MKVRSVIPHGIRVGEALAALSLFLACVWTPLAAQQPFDVVLQKFDIVIIGGTPGGITSALAAARQGHTVSLVEYNRHLGGMASGGLGKSDVETRAAIGGIFKEFVGRVYRHYVDKYGAHSENVRQCRDGYYYEPHVAEQVFDEMLAAESTITVLRHHRLDEAVRRGRRLAAARVTNRATGETIELRGRVFIDATYEGDLAAYAGARYRLGRESRDEFGELHAGVVYQDHQTRRFLAGTTGAGDRRLPAYTYRLCLTSDPANSHVMTAPPPGYDRERYLGYFDDLEAGRLGPPKQMREGLGYYSPHFNTLVRALSFAGIPAKKFDVNMNPRPLGFPFAAENYDYPEADWEQREEIIERLRNITLGLLYFLQNDTAIPAEHRRMANQYHLAKDEFTDNGHFPEQLYIREARRIRGEYTLTENDVILAPGLGRTRIQSDSIASGEFPIDSFPVRKRESGHDVALEGYILMLDGYTQPYQIPYRIMVPEEVEGLLVPAAASTTHVAFSTIRLEPTWMVMGQAAGVAAHLAIEHGVEPRAISIQRLQRILVGQGQVLTYFEDIDPEDPAFAAMQYFGTKGFFTDYQARSGEAVTRAEAVHWLRLALDLGGDHRPAGQAAHSHSASVAEADHYQEDTATLALAGVLPDPGAAVPPGRPVSGQEWQSWQSALARVLKMTPASARPAGSAVSTRTASRGEACRDLYALLTGG